MKLVITNESTQNKGQHDGIKTYSMKVCLTSKEAITAFVALCVYLAIGFIPVTWTLIDYIWNLNTIPMWYACVGLFVFIPCKIIGDLKRYFERLRLKVKQAEEER